LKSIFFAVVLSVVCAAIHGQQLKTAVYPGEDELLEALILNEISQEEYDLLVELFRHGIDSSNVYQLELIPNLSYFKTFYEEYQSFLEQPDKRKSTLYQLPPDNYRGYVSFKFYQKFNQVESRYRSNLMYESANHWKVLIKLDREYSGKERFVYRNFRYNPKNSFIKEFIVGSNSYRAGLGTVFGYRGKLLNYSDEIDRESFSFPDYGGENGIFVAAGNSNAKAILQLSRNRDDNFDFVKLLSEFRFKKHKSFPALIVSLTKIRNRESNMSQKDFKTALYKDFTFKNGYSRFELTRQSGIRSAQAVVTENKFKINKSSFRFSAWFYGEDFLDLNSGSKSGKMTSQISIDLLDFSFSSRRNNQYGFLLKSSSHLSEKLSTGHSFLYSIKNTDSSNIEFLSAVSRKLNLKSTFKLDFLHKRKIRNSLTSRDESITQKIRLEFRFKDEKSYLRIYTGYKKESGNSDYLIIFAQARKNVSSANKFEIWANLGEYNLDSKKIDYFYAYFQEHLRLFDRLETTTKFGYSYSRKRTIQDEFTISFTVKVLI